jgi:23S rRNA (adenine2030-N6)-methyltransferase
VKYRHAFHAGNFADVLKHVTLLALLRSLTKKDKGLLLLDTHAGRGLYDLSSGEARQANEAAGGIERLMTQAAQDEAKFAAFPEIVDYLKVVRETRQRASDRQAYPGSPLIALAALRPQDRLTLIESQPAEHAALREAVKTAGRQARDRGRSPESITIECADGYSRLPAWLPPIERRALVVIDPPYEETAADFKAVERTAQEALRRLANAVIAIWYPIKQVKDTDAWRSRLISALPQKAGGEAVAGLTLELWIHPLDNRVGLNGSGMLLINPPFQFEDRARHWLPALHAALDPQGGGGCAVR